MDMSMHSSGKPLALLFATLAAAGAIGAGGALARADISDGFSNSSNWALNAWNASGTYGMPALPTGADTLVLTSDNGNEISSSVIPK